MFQENDLEKLNEKYNITRKQFSEAAVQRCSENMQQIYRRHPCRSAISIKLFRNFMEIALLHMCSPVNLLHINSFF